MSLTQLLALPVGVDCTDVTSTDEHLIVTLQSTPLLSACPRCHVPSARIHSHYQRTIADVPCGNRRVVLSVRVRKFFCRTSHCERRIFTERLPLLARPWARMTERLRQALVAIGLATSGKQGQRLAQRLGMQTSPTSVNRLILALPPFPSSSVHVLGIDDWAFRRGHRYGTILVDLEHHRVVGLLAERTVATTAAWLQQHPEIQYVSRDRGGVYAEGVRRGQPQALQIADRWHLLKNLGDAVERFVARKHLGQVLAETQHPDRADTILQLPTPLLNDRPLSAKKQARFAHITRLRAEGLSIHAIARQVGVTRATVRRYVTMEAATTKRHWRRTKLDPFRVILTRFNGVSEESRSRG